MEGTGQELVVFIPELLSSRRPVLAWWTDLGDLQWSFLPLFLSLCAAPATQGAHRTFPGDLAWRCLDLCQACLPTSLPACSGSPARSTSCLWMLCSPPCRREEKAAVPQLEQETGLLKFWQKAGVGDARQDPHLWLFATQGCPQP